MITLTQVIPELYRGYRPTTREDFVELKRMGIKTVLDLESGTENEPFCLATEVGIIPLELKNCPVFPPTKEHVQAVLRIFQNPIYHPILAHCRSNVDRTGFMFAAYRMQVQGWTYERALDEMVTMGRHWWLAWWCWSLPKVVEAKTTDFMNR